DVFTLRAGNSLPFFVPKEGGLPLEADGRDRAPPDLALQVQRPAHAVAEPARDRQPHATPGLAGRVAPIERVERTRERLRVHPDAAVADLDPVHFQPYFDLPVVGEVGGV